MTTFNNTFITVQPEVIQDRIPSRDVDDAELSKAFNARFVCIRERDLEKQQGLEEKIGAIAVYNAAVDNLCGTCNNIATMGRAYLDTLSPISD
jgi:hypothetical protein